MFEELPLNDLLQRWKDEIGQVQRSEGWLAQFERVRAPSARVPDGAAGAEIDALERRLGRALPPSYRQFLEFANGWPSFDRLRGGFRPAQTVGWFIELEREWYEIWRDIDADIPDLPLMARALIVTEPGDEALLLDPDEIDDHGEWASYTFSNWAAGSNRLGQFRAAVEHQYTRFLNEVDDFLIEVDAPSRSLAEVAAAVEEAYLALLAGDIERSAVLTDAWSLSWRAQLLSAQFDLFGQRVDAGDSSSAIHQLWWGDDEVAALANPVLMRELVPAYVVRQFEDHPSSVDFEIGRAPSPVAALMTEYAAMCQTGDGIVADFSYAPEFTAAIEPARQLAIENRLDEAWSVVQAALPLWRPMSADHLLPVGLYYDRDFSRVLREPPSPKPVAAPAADASGRSYVYTFTSVRPEPPLTSGAWERNRKLPRRSERLIEVLRTPFRP